jgi:hypothetical protein
MARAIARFIGPNDVNPLVALVRIAGRFPAVSLDVALAGFVFRKLWLEMERKRKERLQ